MGRGMSLASVMSLLVVTPSPRFLCEARHRPPRRYLLSMQEKSRQKGRLDALLATRGVYDSRSRAAAAVMAGEVRVGPQRTVASKSGMLVAPDVEIEVSAGRRYVSRGGQKLERALATFGVGVRDRLCLDVGASTGGFTDRLLQGGAARVVCVDVAYGELDWRLREDPRVTVLERTNARHLNKERLPYAPELIVADVSFIGLAKVLPAVAACAATRFDLIALVKPQFEVGRDRVGRGGVVRDPSDRLEALVAAGASAVQAGMSVQGYCS